MTYNQNPGWEEQTERSGAVKKNLKFSTWAI